jgi:hypothetical protein
MFSTPVGNFRRANASARPPVWKYALLNDIIYAQHNACHSHSSADDGDVFRTLRFHIQLGYRWLTTIQNPGIMSTAVQGKGSATIEKIATDEKHNTAGFRARHL